VGVGVCVCEKFIDNQLDDSRSVSTTPLSGDTASGQMFPETSTRLGQVNLMTK